MKTRILFIFFAILLSSCNPFEDYEDISYYKTTGEGYVVYRATQEPVPNARIVVTSYFESRGWGTTLPVRETYIADANGHFKVRFIKRTQKDDVTGYDVSARLPDDSVSMTSSVRSFSVKAVKEAKGVFIIGTLQISFYLTK